MNQFQQECSQSYSPVARWITEVALTLTDESQQYGNIEETSVVARTPRTCLNIWAGDHRQTPGGLKNTVECRLFRQSDSHANPSSREVMLNRMVYIYISTTTCRETFRQTIVWFEMQLEVKSCHQLHLRAHPTEA